MAGGYVGWSDDGRICQRHLSSEFESWIPPVVNMAEGTVFPYYIAWGNDVIEPIWFQQDTDKHSILGPATQLQKQHFSASR